MGPHVSFCRASDGAQLAYSAFGQGPLLVLPPGWVSHLGLQLEYPAVRGFCTRLARLRTVVLYDRRGTGLSERRREDFSLARDVEDLANVVDVVDGARDGTLALLGISFGGPLSIAYTAAHPERVERLVLYGAFSNGERVARPEVRASLVGLVRAHWGLGAQALATLFFPNPQEDPAGLAFFHRFQRESASPEMAARLLEELFAADVDACLPKLHLPTLVLHRVGDKAIAARHGRELAAAIAGAQLQLLPGAIHLGWLGDTEAVLGPLEEFLRAGAREAPARGPGASPAAAPEQAEAPRRQRYSVAHRNLLGPTGGTERAHVRVALAQLGEAEDTFRPREDGLFGLPRERVAAVLARAAALVDEAHRRHVDVLLFPELVLDLAHEELERQLRAQAEAYGLLIVPGAYHDPTRRANVCRVLGPDGLTWEQEKHIPAVVKLGPGERVVEPIRTPAGGRITVAATPFGRIAVAICRDFLDLDLRVALRNAEPPVDLVLNPAYTPVTADFAAAHFEARRSLYACCLFCNVAHFGGSLISSPEKRRRRQVLPAGREGLLWRDVDLAGLRAERTRWAEVSHAQFIQSTR